ncbi:MAG TPA: hypothetical protein VHO50_04015 [Bacteroidales bacterium]|nr:hypothetical protein [Bacteroidales bacterium]
MMKRITLLLLLLSVCSLGFAQNDFEDEQENENNYYHERSNNDEDNDYRDKEFKTLFGNNREGGVYSAFTGGYSEIDDEQAVLFGARFGWMAGHAVGVGLGATGFINEYHNEPALGSNVFLAGGYGGLYIEPVVMPRFPVHLSFPVLLGAGGISYITKYDGDNNNFIEDSEAFLIVEPSAEIEINLTRFFRLAVGASYRLPTAFDIGMSGVPGIGAESIKGVSYNVSLKFGRF